MELCWVGQVGPLRPSCPQKGTLFFIKKRGCSGVQWTSFSSCSELLFQDHKNTKMLISAAMQKVGGFRWDLHGIILVRRKRPATSRFHPWRLKRDRLCLTGNSCVFLFVLLFCVFRPIATKSGRPYGVTSASWLLWRTTHWLPPLPLADPPRLSVMKWAA